MQRLPGTFLFVFGDAEAVFGRCALRPLVEFVRPNTECVHHDQPKCATDRGVGTEAWAKDSSCAVEAEPLANRTVHDDQLRLAGGALNQCEIAEALECR